MKYIIIGSGIAGLSAALKIRSLDSVATISIISEEEVLPYYRPTLTKQLGNDINSFNFFIKKQDYFVENNICIFLSEKVTNIDYNLQVVNTNKNSFQYDKLLLATGAHCFSPNFNTTLQQPPFTLRSYSDFVKISNAIIEPLKHINIIGGGVLGLELAESCQKKNHHVTILEMTPYLLMRNLPSQASTIIVNILKENNITVHCNCVIESLNNNSIIYNNGTVLDSSIIIVSAGARANTELAEDVLITNRFGICVNEYMNTSHKNVYAAGDCASFCNNPISGLWIPAQRQGEIAGINMTGKPQAFTQLSEPLRLILFGNNIFSVGSFIEPNQTTTIIFQSASQLVAVSTVNEKIVGACSINNQAITSHLKNAFEKKLTISEAKLIALL